MERILIFLFVNGKCYGTQLHRLLKVPLTPLQKALNRLEVGNIITSYYEGKTRLYQFNPAYPFMTELELLLKKAYTLLSAHDKKEYYVTKIEYGAQSLKLESKTQVVLAFWKKLVGITQLTFNSKAKSEEQPSGRNGRGKGEVESVKVDSNVLIFNERGTWQSNEGTQMAFSNVFRWTLDRKAGLISLEHLRRGPDHPVFLFNLTPTGKNSLSPLDSHLCAGDTYFGQIHFDQQGLRLNWRVIGPSKNEEMDYYYM
ncbi:MAG: winged helix-turn-helix transcriptional regulator [Parachlamydiaceae bacterium]|nr:winged helix-turn-helix transcriptional regulator [Parachlamydiaceae bacterium]